MQGNYFSIPIWKLVQLLITPLPQIKEIKGTYRWPPISSVPTAQTSLDLGSPGADQTLERKDPKTQNRPLCVAANPPMVVQLWGLAWSTGCQGLPPSG